MTLTNIMSGMQQKLPVLGLSNQVGPIGVDFGMERINLIQLTYCFDEIKIQAAKTIPYPLDRESLLEDPVSLKKLLKSTLQRSDFKNNNAVAVLPPSMVQLVLINYQCTRNQDRNDALIKAVSEQFSEKLEHSVIDYLPIRPKVNEQLDHMALVAIAKHEDVVNFLERLRFAGLKVRSLEIGPVAIRRLITNLEDKSEDLHKIMAINFAMDNSFVTVLWGGELLLDREINIGLNTFVNAVCESLEITFSQAQKLIEAHGLVSNIESDTQLDMDFLNEDIQSTLMHILKPIFLEFAKEVKKVLIYTAAETQGGAIDMVYILGSIARWPKIDSFLSDIIKLPIKTVNPFFGFSPNDPSIAADYLEPVAGIAVATGLALHGMNKHG